MAGFANGEDVMEYQTITIAGKKIDINLINHGFVAGSSMAGCNGSCCRSGVYIDIRERDRILLHKDAIKYYMDETQVQDERQWFDDEILEDMDFKSGHAVGTSVFNDKCTFLTKHGKCSIQLMERDQKLSRFSVKPFYCVLYPITIDQGVITFDDYVERKECCAMGRGEPMSILDVCREELIYLLGEEGFKELFQISLQRAQQIQQTV